MSGIHLGKSPRGGGGGHAYSEQYSILKGWNCQGRAQRFQGGGGGGANALRNQEPMEVGPLSYLFTVCKQKKVSLFFIKEMILSVITLRVNGMY